MNDNDLINSIENEWDFDTGFFGLLRRGEFDLDKYNRLLVILKKIKCTEDVINRRLVSLVWYIPLFMEWQAERVQSSGVKLSEYEKSINKVQNLVERILGVP
jgi:hypothetical protein